MLKVRSRREVNAVFAHLQYPWKLAAQIMAAPPRPPPRLPVRYAMPKTRPCAPTSAFQFSPRAPDRRPPLLGIRPVSSIFFDRSGAGDCPRDKFLARRCIQPVAYSRV